MKTIERPAPVEILLGVLPDGKEVKKTLTFVAFLTDVFDWYGGAKTPRQLREVIRVMDAIEKKADGPLELEDNQYDLLKAAIEWPREAGFSVKYARQAWTFYEALEKAGIGV